MRKVGSVLCSLGLVFTLATLFRANPTSAADLSISEGSTGLHSVQVTLDGPFAAGSSTPYWTEDGTATTADGDYTELIQGNQSYVCPIGPDCAVALVWVEINGDTTAEPDEDFSVVFATGSSVVTLQNDDGPVPTDTPTSTPTDTPTNTPTNTPTDTPTNTPTDTPTNTPTDTPTSTPTETPTNTPTETATSTPTNTPTETPTSTATATDTPDATATAAAEETVAAATEIAEQTATAVAAATRSANRTATAAADDDDVTDLPNTGVVSGPGGRASPELFVGLVVLLTASSILLAAQRRRITRR
jgi:hypothetical protein